MKHGHMVMTLKPRPNHLNGKRRDEPRPKSQKPKNAQKGDYFFSW